MAGEFPQNNQVPSSGANPDAARRAYEAQQAAAAQQAQAQAQARVQAAQAAVPQQGSAPQQGAPQPQAQRVDYGHYAPSGNDYAFEQGARASSIQASASPLYTADDAHRGSGAQAASEPKGGALRSFLSFLLMLAIVLGCAWLLRTFVIAPYEIPSGSMENTIMISDKVFSEKISYYMHGVQPGDIVTFADPEVEGRTLIKRCIAVGGQTVEVRDGSLYVDGQLMDEPYVNGRETLELQPADGVEISYPYTVPQGYIWVMGDNRTNSADSRYFGAVPEASVSGHAVCIYWPIERIGGLG